MMQDEKRPGQDWMVTYLWLDEEEDGEIETMAVFGAPTEAEARDEAHTSLSLSGADYEIISVTKATE